jgi:hypothetical protein
MAHAEIVYLRKDSLSRFPLLQPDKLTGAESSPAESDTETFAP